MNIKQLKNKILGFIKADSKDISPTKFQFLTPSKNAEKVEVYISALNKALEDEDVKNIAISGSYGAGKSSFIKTFENRNNKHHFLDISLATFQKDDKDMSLIEKSILQQIFYKVEQQSIPQSRFKRINTVGWLALKAIFVVLFILSFLIFFDSKYVEFLHYPNDLKFVPLVFLLVGIYTFSKSIMQNFTGVSLEKLNLQNLEIKTHKEDETSLLNNYLDEILYFFSQTKYSIVVFQDLDRFENLEIFTKLRELNNFLNNSEQVKKRHKKIVFLYALRDEMFKNNDNKEKIHKDDDNKRTKFFDFMIPVIPYINSSTSYDKLLLFFKKYVPDDKKNNEQEEKETNPKKIKAEEKEAEEKEQFKDFLRDIALYIKDMRLLKNIYNEYIIYDEKIGNGIDKVKLLAMVVYKNFYPDDFDLLHKDQGMVFNIFKNKNKYIKDTDEKLTKNIKELLIQIKQIENEQPSKINELRMIYIYKIIQKLGNGQNQYLYCNNKQIYISQAILDNNFIDIQTSNNIRNTHYSTSNTTFSEVEKEISSLTYEEREELILNKSNGTIEKLETKIKELKEQQKSLHIQSLKQLRNFPNTKELITQDLQNKELLQYLIFNGHIDENYYLYLSYSFDKSLTPSDTEFLKNVINDNNISYDHKLTNLEELLEKLKINEFQKKSILNYDLINFLIENKLDYKEQYETVFEQLSNSSNESIDFIFAYIDFLPQNNKIINEISQHWTSFWQYIYENDNFTVEQKDDYFYLLLYNIPTKTFEQLNKNNCLKKYIENLTKLRDLATDDINKFQKIIKSLDIKFSNLSEHISTSNLPIFFYIYDNNRYIINKLMIEKIAYTHLAPKTAIEKKLYTQHLTTIIEYDISKKLLKNIEQNISQYIDEIFLQIENNTEENEETIIWLLNNDNLSDDQKINIINQQNIVIEDISKMTNSELLETLFNQNKVKANWDNVGLFYNLTSSLTDTLIEYLNNKDNANELSKVRISTDFCNEHKDFNTQILKDILESDKFNISSYKMLIQANGFWYETLDNCKLNEEKIDALVNGGKLKLTTENIENLIECSLSKHINLIEKQFNSFIEKFDEISISLKNEDFVKFFESSNLTDDSKFTLLEHIDIESFEMDENLALSLSELYSRNKKGMEKTLLEKIIAQLPSSSGLRSINHKLIVLVFQLSYIDYELDCDEIHELLEYLGSPYNELCEELGAYRQIKNTKDNVVLAKILDDKNCISSVTKISPKDKKIRINRKRES